MTHIDSIQEVPAVCMSALDDYGEGERRGQRSLLKGMLVGAGIVMVSTVGFFFMLAKGGRE